MPRVTVVLVMSIVLMLPAASAAPSEGGTHVTATDVATYPRADSDGNGISDGLDAALVNAGPGDRFDVVATFENTMRAGASLQALPDQALNRRFALVSGFSALLNKGQINALSHQPGIIRVEENFKVETTNDSANADFGTALARTDYGVDGTGVGICIPDTGYDPNHEQLDDPGKLAGWFDAVNGAGTAYDDHGHGTHVAATAAGAGTGGPDAATYRGVAPAATIYAAKVLNSAGSSVADTVEQGLAWCVAQAGVDIISMSLGEAVGSDGLDILSQAVNAAVDAGKIVVIAAGNSGDGPETVGSPGAAEKAITVGAAAEWSAPRTEDNHSDGIYLAPFSSRGPTLAPSLITKPDIVAPGVTITSATAGSAVGYSTSSGTSMATPFTAGTIALMLDADPTLTYAEVIALLSATAHDRGPVGKDNHWGWGLIDGYALVAEASGSSSYNATRFPSSSVITGSVAAGGVWSHTFTLGPDDLGSPIAATVILEGSPSCVLDLGPLGCLLWEWNPDLEARLFDPSSALLGLSECPARGDCGLVGQQETLHTMPTVVGTYTLEVFPVTTGGSFAVDLSFGSGGVADVSPPSVSVVSPVNWSSVSVPVVVEGSASDDVGVAGVSLEIYDRDTGLWWNGCGWQVARTGVDASLAGGDWSYSFDPGSPASQPYWVTVRSFDAAGNPSSYVYTNFAASSADVSPPSVSVVSPVNWSSVSVPVVVEGSASDDVGVAGVSLEIYDRDTGLWWNGSGWQVARTGVDACWRVATGRIRSIRVRRRRSRIG